MCNNTILPEANTIESTWYFFHLVFYRYLLTSYFQHSIDDCIAMYDVFYVFQLHYKFSFITWITKLQNTNGLTALELLIIKHKCTHNFNLILRGLMKLTHLYQFLRFNGFQLNTFCLKCKRSIFVNQSVFLQLLVLLETLWKSSVTRTIMFSSSSMTCKSY